MLFSGSARNEPSWPNNNITCKLFILCTPRNRLVNASEQPDNDFFGTLNKLLLTKMGTVEPRFNEVPRDKGNSTYRKFGKTTKMLVTSRYS